MEAKKSILIIDDEKDILEVLSEFFESFEWGVVSASGGELALETLEEHANDISVIISDYRMPNLSGGAFLKEIRSRGFMNPTIFFSGACEKAEIIEILKLGAFDFLEKGFDYYSLLESADLAHQAWEMTLDQAHALADQGSMVAASPGVAKVISIAERRADGQDSVVEVPLIESKDDAA